AFLLFANREGGADAPITSLTELEKRLSEAEIEKLTVDPNSEEIEVEEKDRDAYRIAVPVVGDEEGMGRLMSEARERGIEITALPRDRGESPMALVMRIIPTLLIGAIVILVLMQYTGFGSGRRVE